MLMFFKGQLVALVGYLIVTPLLPLAHPMSFLQPNQ